MNIHVKIRPTFFHYMMWLFSGLRPFYKKDFIQTLYLDIFGFYSIKCLYSLNQGGFITEKFHKLLISISPMQYGPAILKFTDSPVNCGCGAFHLTLMHTINNIKNRQEHFTTSSHK